MLWKKLDFNMNLVWHLCLLCVLSHRIRQSEIHVKYKLEPIVSSGLKKFSDENILMLSADGCKSAQGTM